MNYSIRSGLRDHSTECEKPDCLYFLHRVACTICAVVAAFCLLRCLLSFSCALDDARKHGVLGIAYPLWYYLGVNDFPETVGLFLCVVAELMMYITLCRREDQYIPFRGSIGYFAIALVIHAAMCLHVNALLLPSESPVTPADMAAIHYRRFANTTMLPSAVYFVMYLWRTWRLRSGGR